MVVSSDSIEYSMKRAGNRTVWGPLLHHELPAEGDEWRPAFLTEQAVVHWDTVRPAACDIHCCRVSYRAGCRALGHGAAHYQGPTVACF